MKGMKICSPDAERFRRGSNIKYYVGAVLGAFLLFSIILIIFKGITFLVGFLVSYWIIILGVIAGFLILKKIFTKKKMVMVRE